MKPFPEARFEPAPPARRLWIILTLVLVLLAVLDVVAVLQMSRVPPEQRWVLLLATVPGWLIVLGIWWSARIRSYVLRDGQLLVSRRVRSPRFSLEGLESVEQLRTPLTGLRKVWGNDGLGAVSGTFRCKEWGTIKLFLSDPARTVVLRWRNGEVVLVSPDRPQPFIEAVRRLALQR